METSKPSWHYCPFSLPPPQLSKHGMSISLTSLRHSSSFKETIDHTDAKLILFENSFCSLQRIASLGTKRSTCFFYRVFFEKEKIGILLPKFVLTYCEKKKSSDREKLLKFEAEGREFSKFLRSLEQFIQTVKGQNNVW